MDTFWLVTLFHWQPSPGDWSRVESVAINQFKALGIEEFSLNEVEVDAILGERSYSGGDLPQEVLDEVENKVLKTPQNYRFFFDDRTSAQGFCDLVKVEILCEVQVEEQKQEDWNAEWKKHYAPIKVNEAFEIIPSWQTDYKPKSRDHIYIYPGMGFGTGSHETTFLCLRLFTEQVVSQVKVQHVLDFGSGSGILGLSVFKFFPDARVDFYDIDLEANKNCYQNAEINNLTEKSFRLLLPDYRSQLLSQYDLVFANILEGILLGERDLLISSTKEGGFLILSGLLNHQVKNILDNYTMPGLVLVQQASKGDWSALLFRKHHT